MIMPTQLDQIKEELIYCKRPIFFFHDDPDGLCSFLLLYRFVGTGKGVAVKTVPRVTKEIFAKKVTDYGADKVFILDVAEVEEDFVKAVRCPVIWIDHHEPVKIEGVRYFNPRIENKNEYSPVSYWCYKVIERDLWIAVVGCIGDAFYPPFFDEFAEQYPDLAGIKTKDILKLNYETRLGRLVRIFSFIMMGTSKDAMKCVKVLTRIQTPYEILNQTSAQGKFIYKKFQKIDDEYQKIFMEAKESKPKGNLFFFTYKSALSLTKDLANEFCYIYPDKAIVIGREKSGELKVSLRWKKDIRSVLQKALKGVEGYGGGHENACGANISLKDVDRFMGVVRKEIEQ